MSKPTPDRVQFAQAIEYVLATLSQDLAAGVEAVSELLMEIEQFETSDLEKSSYASRLLLRLPRTETIEAALVETAKSLGPAIKNAVASELPDPIRGEIFREARSFESKQTSHSLSAGEPISRISAGSSSVEADGPRTVGFGDETEIRTQQANGPGTDENEWRAILLLGDKLDTQMNTDRVKLEGFDPITVESLSELENVRSQPVCGIAIHPSWWKQFDSADDQHGFLRDLLTSSNVLAFRVAEKGFHQNDRVEDLSHDYAPNPQHVQFDAECELIGADFAVFDRVAQILDTAARTNLIADGLTTAERQLVAHAVMTAPDAKPAGTIPPAELSVRQLTAGKSSARVYQVKPQWRHGSYVIKIDSEIKLRQEIENALSISWANAAMMRILSNLDAAVLIQPMQGRFEDPEIGAPSLRERLFERFAWERGRPGMDEPDITKLRTAIERVVHEVRQINVANNIEASSNCWIRNEPIATLKDAGVVWTVDAAAGTFNPIDHISAAEQKIVELKDSRLAHGDLHAANILLTDDDIPTLIDFAYAGAGHPCFDLVRASMDIAFTFLRPVVTESRLREYFESAVVEGQNSEWLRENFPELLTSELSNLASDAIVIFRDAALEFLDEHNAGVEHYLAMVYVVAAQDLTMPEYESIVVRAALAAVQPQIASLDEAVTA